MKFIIFTFLCPLGRNMSHKSGLLKASGTSLEFNKVLLQIKNHKKAKQRGISKIVCMYGVIGSRSIISVLWTRMKILMFRRWREYVKADRGWWLESFQDFLFELDVKPCMNLVEISNFLTRTCSFLFKWEAHFFHHTVNSWLEYMKSELEYFMTASST